jgi:hypothetical protein
LWKSLNLTFSFYLLQLFHLFELFELNWLVAEKLFLEQVNYAKLSRWNFSERKVFKMAIECHSKIQG